MFVLAMAAFRANQLPAISLQETNYVGNLHAADCRDGLRQFSFRKVCITDRRIGRQRSAALASYAAALAPFSDRGPLGYAFRRSLSALGNRSRLETP